jgi:hypothetical protein
MKKIIILISAVILILGCTTQRITNTWKTDEVVPNDYNKVLVLGLIIDADRSIQENMENHLAGDLRALGYNTVTSLKEFGPKAFDKMTEEDAIDKLKGKGIDAVVTIVLLDKLRERAYVPRDMNYSPFGYYNSYFWDYHRTMYRRIYSPGYFVVNTRYFWESNLFDMSNQKLIYSAQTQSFDPVDSEMMGHRYGKMIVKNMVAEKLLLDKSVR